MWKLILDYWRGVFTKPEPDGVLVPSLEDKETVLFQDSWKKESLPWTAVVYHHTKTKDGEVKDFDAIKRYHIEVKKWDDIGYHFVIEFVDGVVKVIKGRSLSQPGAHTLGMNNKAIGVAIVGDFDKAPPDEEVLKVCIAFGKELAVNFPGVIHYYHRDFSTKTCPGLQFTPRKAFRLALTT